MASSADASNVPFMAPQLQVLVMWRGQAPKPRRGPRSGGLEGVTPREPAWSGRDGGVLLPEQAVDAGPPDPELPCDRRRAKVFLAAKPPDLGNVDRWLTAFVDSARLRGIDALHLALTAQVGSNSANTPSMARNA